jgi:membrane carboxypeptidase/penicillin-binding protein
MLAGLPKAPSAYNPIVNPNRAKLRQNTFCAACTNSVSLPKPSTPPP